MCDIRICFQLKRIRKKNSIVVKEPGVSMFKHLHICTTENTNALNKKFWTSINIRLPVIKRAGSERQTRGIVFE